MVSNASDDLPDPDRPVMTTRASRGRDSEMSRRLCSRAPETTMQFLVGGIRRPVYGGEQTFARSVPARCEERANPAQRACQPKRFAIARNAASAGLSASRPFG